MKVLIHIFIIILSINSCYSNEVKNTYSKIEINDSVNVSPIIKLGIGKSYYYKTYRTSCIAGDLMGIMDSVCIYRDSINVKIKYKNKDYTLDETKINAISQIELKILSVQNVASSSYLNYIIKDENNEGLLGSDDGNIWNELIKLITSWT